MHFNLNYKELPSPSLKVVRHNFIDGMSQLLQKEFQVNNSTSTAIANCVFARMNNTNLWYHTPVHVLSIFQYVEELQNLYSADQLVVEPIDQLALWFHDAIYRPVAKPGENEEDSAAFALSLIGRFLTNPDDLQQRIHATSQHTVDDVLPCGRLIMDLDICSFSWDWQYFQRAQELVALEFIPLVGKEQFDLNRKLFLKVMLDKPFIYRTQFFKETFEQKAKENLTRAINEIKLPD